MTRPPIGARIRLNYDPYEATVIEHTRRGFRYEYDRPVPFGRGQEGNMTGGEIYCDIEVDTSMMYTVTAPPDSPLR